MLVRPMVPGDLDAAVEIGFETGWGDLRSFIAYTIENADAYPLVAEVDGQLVGTVLGTQRGHVGWIGLVAVRAAYRSQGIGKALTQAVLTLLERLECHTVQLIASEAGRPLYQKLGFQVEAYYHRFAGPVRTDRPEDPRLRPLVAADHWQQICWIDRLATGEDRSYLLRPFRDQGWVITDEPGHGRVTGFYLPTPWGLGALVANNSDDGLALLELKRWLDGQAGRTQTKADVLGTNVTALGALKRAGFEPVAVQPRMVRGHALRWQPNTIFGVVAGAMG